MHQLLAVPLSTLRWLNLIWNISTKNKRALLLGHVKNWADDVQPGSGNGAPHSSAASQTNSTCHPLPSAVPSPTTKATGLNSVTSDKAPARHNKSRSTVLSSLLVHTVNENNGEERTTLPVQVACRHTAKLVACTNNTTIHPEESDDEFDMPVSKAARAGSKRKAGLISEYVVAHEVDEADNEESDVDHPNRDICMWTAKEARVTVVVRPLIRLSALLMSKWQTNNIVNKPAKKMKTGNNNQANTMAEDSGQSVPVDSMPSQMSSNGTNSVAGAHTSYINGHLPTTLQKDGKWTKQILPALLTWAGSLTDPWVIPDQDLMQTLRIIIITVNPDFVDVIDIRHGTPIFMLAIRGLNMWRSNFGSTAITLIAHFLTSGPDGTQPDDTVLETCNDLLKGLTFLYQDVGPRNPVNAFQSPFVLYLLDDAHLRPCIRCPDITRLDTNALKEHGIKGAIALCCSALECTIRLFQRNDLCVDMRVDDQINTCGKATVHTPLKLSEASGKETLTALAFSEENWGLCTGQYAISIAKRDHAALKEIVMLAISTDILLEDDNCQSNLMAEDLRDADANELVDQSETVCFWENGDAHVCPFQVVDGKELLDTFINPLDIPFRH
ncbi:hypothetical protein SCLCIDRAFT_23899 [Scleroderma citrinum Foug A]|uniref:Uncharacterized protein n=1 Tax=Scleroderma citrinum Foug A TaxID=1036808 RepID=A0A0C3AGM2_9AGAM|nr:hypothetical protein SCLCIDRAFT_23899 [Scleroderma citrinum Foug A]